MSVASLGASTSAYSYLQSLLQQQSANNPGATGPADPVTTLLAAFYPAGGGGDQSSSASSSAATSSSSASNVSLFSPETLGALITVQGQQSDPGGRVAARAQAVFKEFDANSDGQISKSEFESAFGSKADMSKVDGLFNALDTNGDGSISQGELTSAAEQSHAHHHHMHGPDGGGGEGGGGLAALLSSIDVSGATAQTSSNADGSTSTTISYADGSTVTMTTPAASSDSGSGAGSSSSSGSGNATANLLEKLISWQAKLLASSSNTTDTIA